jgi:hypothetical protein
MREAMDRELRGGSGNAARQPAAQWPAKTPNRCGRPKSLVPYRPMPPPGAPFMVDLKNAGKARCCCSTSSSSDDGRLHTRTDSATKLAAQAPEAERPPGDRRCQRRRSRLYGCGRRRGTACGRSRVLSGSGMAPCADRSGDADGLSQAAGGGP